MEKWFYGYIFSCDDEMSADSEDLGEQHNNKFWTLIHTVSVHFQYFRIRRIKESANK